MPRLAEISRPLVEERAHAFHIFLARAGLALEIALEVELGVEIIAGRSGERALDEAERMGRAAREALGDDARLSHQILVVDGAIDHARGLGLLRRRSVRPASSAPGRAHRQ